MPTFRNNTELVFPERFVRKMYRKKIVSTLYNFEFSNSLKMFYYYRVMNEIRIFVTFNIIQLCFRNSNQYNYPPKTNEEEREITISKFYD